MVDTLKTAGVGTVGMGIQFMDMVPDAAKVVIAIATVGYLIVKVKNELGK